VIKKLFKQLKPKLLQLSVTGKIIYHFKVKKI
jgi:hypothetical protein